MARSLSTARPLLRLVIGSVTAGVLFAVGCSASPDEPADIVTPPADEAAARDAPLAPDATTDQSTPPCPEARKRCAVDFAFSASAEGQVEVRGDFAQGAWTAGVPMTNFGDTWRRSLLFPLGARVEYKFCIDPKAD